jgi:hypothetical protein
VSGKLGSSSRLRSYFVAAIAGLAVALVDYALGLWLSSHGLHAEITFIDEFLLAIFTGALVLVTELSHRRNQQRLTEKLRTIELMNHHVRNALQTIVDSAYIHGNLEEVRAAVDRIAWALQEILPGQSSESSVDPNLIEQQSAKFRPKSLKSGSR